MTYKTYITEALVCGSAASNTSDRSYLLFTREAGMLYATARSVREERSKQRYALQECSHIRATLIRGKNGWRIAGVEPIANYYASALSRNERTFVRNVLLLLRRVLHGEVAHEDIFHDVVRGLSAFSEISTHDCEIVLSLRILYILGYVPPHVLYDSLLDADTLEAACTQITHEVRQVCVEAIAHALRESHL